MNKKERKQENRKKILEKGSTEGFLIIYQRTNKINEKTAWKEYGNKTERL